MFLFSVLFVFFFETFVCSICIAACVGRINSLHDDDDDDDDNDCQLYVGPISLSSDVMQSKFDKLIAINQSTNQ